MFRSLLQRLFGDDPLFRAVDDIRQSVRRLSVQIDDLTAALSANTSTLQTLKVDAQNNANDVGALKDALVALKAKIGTDHPAAPDLAAAIEAATAIQTGLSQVATTLVAAHDAANAALAPANTAGAAGAGTGTTAAVDAAAAATGTAGAAAGPGSGGPSSGPSGETATGAGVSGAVVAKEAGVPTGPADAAAGAGGAAPAT